MIAQLNEIKFTRNNKIYVKYIILERKCILTVFNNLSCNNNECSVYDEFCKERLNRNKKVLKIKIISCNTYVKK